MDLGEMAMLTTTVLPCSALNTIKKSINSHHGSSKGENKPKAQKDKIFSKFQKLSR